MMTRSVSAETPRCRRALLPEGPLLRRAGLPGLHGHSLTRGADARGSAGPVCQHGPRAPRPSAAGRAGPQPHRRRRRPPRWAQTPQAPVSATVADNLDRAADGARLRRRVDRVLGRPRLHGQRSPAINPVLVNLLHALAPGQAPVIRIGGNSTDRTWWPVRHAKAPGGVTYTLTPGWLQTTRRARRATSARLIIGRQPGRRPARPGRDRGAGVPPGHRPRYIEALEIGNEPDVYSEFPWYTGKHGLAYYARPHDYDLSVYRQDFSALGGRAAERSAGRPGLRRAHLAERPGPVHRRRAPPQARDHPPLPPAGLRERPDRPRLRLDLHPAAGQLLERDGRLARPLRQASTHDAGLALSRRGDELGLVRRAQTGVSNTFAAVAVGARHPVQLRQRRASTGSTSTRCPARPTSSSPSRTTRITAGSASSTPSTTGCSCSPRLSRPEPSCCRSTRRTARCKIWATRAPNGRTRVVLINKSPSASARVSVQVPGAGGRASLEWLTRPLDLGHHGRQPRAARASARPRASGTLAAAHTDPITGDAGHLLAHAARGQRGALPSSPDAPGRGVDREAARAASRHVCEPNVQLAGPAHHLVAGRCMHRPGPGRMRPGRRRRMRRRL